MHSAANRFSEGEGGFASSSLCQRYALSLHEFLPPSHCLLSSANRVNRLQEASSDIDARSNGGKWRKLAQTKATSVVQTLLEEAKTAKIPAKYVLFDIAMVKKSENVHFRYRGRMQSAPAIFRAATERPGRTKFLLSVEVEASIVFVRYTMLSLEQRRNADKRSIGDLFFASYDELQNLRYMDALLLILKKLIDKIKKRMLFMGKELDEMLEYFLDKLPILWHNCLRRCI